jgi:hypothetical protein
MSGRGGGRIIVMVHSSKINKGIAGASARQYKNCDTLKDRALTSIFSETVHIKEFRFIQNNLSDIFAVYNFRTIIL